MKRCPETFVLEMMVSQIIALDKKISDSYETRYVF